MDPEPVTENYSVCHPGVTQMLRRKLYNLIEEETMETNGTRRNACPGEEQVPYGRVLWRLTVHRRLQA